MRKLFDTISVVCGIVFGANAFAGVGILKDPDPAAVCYGEAQTAMAAAMAKEKSEDEAVRFVKSYTALSKKGGSESASSEKVLYHLSNAKGADTNNLSAYARSVFAKCMEEKSSDANRRAVAGSCFARNQSFDTYAWFRTVKGSREQYKEYYKSANGKDINDAAEQRLDQWYSEPPEKRNEISTGVYELCVLTKGGAEN